MTQGDALGWYNDAPLALGVSRSLWNPVIFLEVDSLTGMTATKSKGKDKADSLRE
jgi:hypothetical protein